MENSKGVAKFQILDSYTKECTIKIIKKYSISPNLKNSFRMGFAIINIDKRRMEGQIELRYEIEILESDVKVASIYLVMDALFKASRGTSNDEFEKLLKYNGAPVLSTICRAYINSISSQSGIPPVVLPLIDFHEFFKNAVLEENKVE